MGNIKAHYLMPHPPVSIPEIGGSASTKIKDIVDANMRVATEISKIKPKVIILITPHGARFQDSMSMLYNDSVCGDFKELDNDNIFMQLDIDKDLTKKIADEAKIISVPTVKLSSKSSRIYNVDVKLDYGAMVPLYFINRKYKDYKLVHITYGDLSIIDLVKFGIAINNAVKKYSNDAVFISSGDLSHTLLEDGPYKYHEDGVKLDNMIIDYVDTNSIMDILNISPLVIDNAKICALKSIYVMLGVMGASDIECEKISYMNTFGVGYLVAKFIVKEKCNNIIEFVKEKLEYNFDFRKQNQNKYIKLSKDSLIYYLKNKEYLPVKEDMLNNNMVDKKGVFVSITKNGQLRGCIGTIYPIKDNVIEEIIYNTIQAATNDNRFDEITESELYELVFSIDVIGNIVEANESELDYKKYGIIVETEEKRAVLLPDLKDINSVEEQIFVALNKAGINVDEEYKIYKFDVIRYKDE